MAELLVGAVAATAITLLIQFVRAKGVPVTRWGWALTVLALFYAVFVLEVIVSFLREGSVKGAMVMGTILGFVAILWGVLLARFVFVGGARRGKEAADV